MSQATSGTIVLGDFRESRAGSKPAPARSNAEIADSASAISAGAKPKDAKGELYDSQTLNVATDPDDPIANYELGIESTTRSES
jgi:hypothetical protein